MTTIIGIDPGDKRIGVAVADLDTKIITPLTTLNNNRSLIAELKKIRNEHNFEKIIIGLPVTSSGLKGEQAKKVIALAEKIKKYLLVEIQYEDERHTSRVAQDHLRQIGEDKTNVDAYAAVLILKSWLDRRKF